MPYFLDGNNLIGRTRHTARPSDEDSEALIAEVANRLRRTRAKAVLFFDGAGGRKTSLGQLSVRYAGARSADEAILAEIRSARAPSEILVVTGDRELARRAQETGARSLSPEDFWQRFGTASGEDPSQEAPKVDVEEWMRYFGEDKKKS